MKFKHSKDWPAWLLQQALKNGAIRLKKKQKQKIVKKTKP